MKDIPLQLLKQYSLQTLGAYTFSNNVIKGWYKLLSSSETISFAGTYDANTKKMTCSLGMGDKTSGQGKCVVSKP
ncbi:MAG: hypothetical protein ABIU77_07625 [Ferruginibacter sp.]